MNRGYVKIWRKIEDSGLIQTPNTLALFMHILLKATHRDIKVGTTSGVIEIKRGQYISGLLKLSSELKQSVQQLRTSLKRLENLNIITVKSTNKYSIYTIENYNNYQDINTQDNNQSTNNQQTDNKQSTTKQEHKHISTEEHNKNITQKTEFFAGIDLNLVNDYLAVRKSKRAPKVSQTVYDGLVRESNLAGVDLSQALRVCIERNWVGFKADWYQSSKTNNSGNGLSVAEQNKINTARAKERLFGKEQIEKDITDATTRL